LAETVFVKSWADVGINSLRTSGKVKVICPSCHDRRTNKSDRSLSVSVDRGVGHCHYCGTSYALEKPLEKPSEGDRRGAAAGNWRKPVWDNRTNLSEKAVKYFESRKIPQRVLTEMKITEGPEKMPPEWKECNTIRFNYFQDGELVNVKYRTGDKRFKMVAGARLIPYNLDAVREKRECIVTEGEFDCLTFIACGFPHTVSVPNGASENTSYLDGCWDEYFEDKDTVYIAVDTDAKGLILRSELVRRFGAERCRIVSYGGECKDANELYIRHGLEAVRASVYNAEEIRVEGVFRVADFEEGLDALYENGLPRGLTTGHANFDALCSFETGRLCVMTGIPGHGKSEFLDEIMERMNIRHGWKAACFSPENFPLRLHASKLVSKLTGKRFGRDSLHPDEYARVKAYMNENFFFIFPDEQFSVDTILEKGRYLVRRHGVKVFAVDPWNRLEHRIPPGMTETNYISQTLDRLTGFAQRQDVLLFLVAHPRKMNRNPSGKYDIPTLYDINGSANFFNKADYGMSVFRDRETGLITVSVQKVKFRHLGEAGNALFQYNINNGRYTPYIDNKLIEWDNASHLKRGITDGYIPERQADAEMRELPFEMGDGGAVPF
jgi:twinkle protein